MTIAPAERVETSLEEIAALDFEPEVPCICCEFHRNPPAKAACYLLRSCGCPAEPYCRKCKAMAQDYAASTAMRCLLCHADPITIRFEPLR